MILFFIFWLYHTACGIFVPQPGIKPAPPALEVLKLNHWTTKEVPKKAFFNFLLLLTGEVVKRTNYEDHSDLLAPFLRTTSSFTCIPFAPSEAATDSPEKF